MPAPRRPSRGPSVSTGDRSRAWDRPRPDDPVVTRRRLHDALDRSSTGHAAGPGRRPVRRREDHAAGRLVPRPRLPLAARPDRHDRLLEAVLDAHRPGTRRHRRRHALALLRTLGPAADPVVVVLEDAHLSTRRTRRLLGRLLGQAPHAARVVLLSRRELDVPGLPARLRAGSLVLRGEDLAFRPDGGRGPRAGLGPADRRGGPRPGRGRVAGVGGGAGARRALRRVHRRPGVGRAGRADARHPAAADPLAAGLDVRRGGPRRRHGGGAQRRPGCRRRAVRAWPATGSSSPRSSRPPTRRPLAGGSSTPCCARGCGAARTPTGPPAGSSSRRTAVPRRPCRTPRRPCGTRPWRRPARATPTPSPGRCAPPACSCWCRPTRHGCATRWTRSLAPSVTRDPALLVLESMLCRLTLRYDEAARLAATAEHALDGLPATDRDPQVQDMVALMTLWRSRLRVGRPEGGDRACRGAAGLPPRDP